MTGWQRSRHCDTNSCVEAAHTGDHVAVRNSQHPDGPIVTFTMDEWRTFIGGARDGDFDFDDGPGTDGR